MKVLVMVKATPESEAGEMPSERLLTEMGKFNEDLVNAGIMLSGEGLHPSSKGARVRFSGQNRTVIDGPFAETKELVAGFWMWQVKSLDEAIEWVKRCPNPMLTESEIEIRPVFSAEDFGEALTPELRAQEARIQAAIEGRESGGHSLPPPRFVQSEEMLIVGASVTYDAQTRSRIPKQWERFSSQLGKVPGQIGKAAYGVCSNYDDSGRFDYLTGVEIPVANEPPPGFAQVRLPAVRYAVFTHDDHVSVLPKTIDAIWRVWLPASGFQPVESPCFERYTEEFDPHTGRGGTEVWVAIKS